MYYHLQLVAAAARSASHRPITSRRTDGNLCLSGGRQQVGQQCIPATREDDHIPVFISKRAGNRQRAGISTSAHCLHNHFWSAVPSVGAPSAVSGPAEDKEMVWGLIPLWDAVLVELQHSEVRLYPVQITHWHLISAILMNRKVQLHVLHQLVLPKITFWPS